MSEFNKTRLYADIADRDDRIKELQAKVVELETQVRSISLSRDTLAAHVERLKSACTKAVEQVPEIACILGFAEATQMKATTILAERDAEVITQFAEKLVEVGSCESFTDPSESDFYFECGAILDFANEYASRVKAGKS